MENLLAEFQAATKSGLQNIAAALDHFSAGVATQIEQARPRAIAAAADDEALPLDVALFDSAPTAAVPKCAKFAALEGIGHRFLVAADGIFVEVRRPWLHLIQKISTFATTGPRPPYGTVEPTIEYAFDRLSAALPHLRRFAVEARSALPREHAAWIIWNADTRALEYRPLACRDATPDGITIDRPPLAAHESLALDLHSHGAAPAFFSPDDDRDDAGEVKISAVLGDLDGAAPSAQFRLCALGLSIPLRVPVEQIFRDADGG